MSSRIEIAFAALTPKLSSGTCSLSKASFAARRMFRGVVLSLETSFKITKACLIRLSYSSLRLALVDMADIPARPDTFHPRAFIRAI